MVENIKIPEVKIIEFYLFIFLPILYKPLKTLGLFKYFNINFQCRTRPQHFQFYPQNNDAGQLIMLSPHAQLAKRLENSLRYFGVNLKFNSK